MTPMLRNTLLTLAIVGTTAMNGSTPALATGYHAIVIPQMDTSALDVIGTRLHIEIMTQVTHFVICSKQFDSVYAHYTIRHWKDISSQVKKQALPLPVRDTSAGATAELRIGLLSADTLEERDSGFRIRLNFEARLIDHVSGQELAVESVKLTYDEAWRSRAGEGVAAAGIAGGLLGAMIADAVMPEGKVRDIRNRFRSEIVEFVTDTFAKKMRNRLQAAN